MNIESAVMTIPYSQAMSQFEAYRSLVKGNKHATKDDVSLYRALWQIKRGQKVIDVQQAIVQGGLNEQGLPRLAIGRAHRPFVHCWNSDGRFVFSGEPRSWGMWSVQQRQIKRNISIRFPGGVGSASGKAQTPLVPAQHRPKGSLASYHILWEAEWQKVPPVDPILLKHIDGPFYVALAQWDLTPLEQAVLRMKL